MTKPDLRGCEPRNKRISFPDCSQSHHGSAILDVKKFDSFFLFLSFSIDGGLITSVINFGIEFAQGTHGKRKMLLTSEKIWPKM
jgi:hypothetical protein